MLAKWIAVGMLGVSLSASAVTKVGNGDDGSDLEKLSAVTTGPLVESRDAAVALLVKLNTAGIRGLGLLLPEVRETRLFEAETDSKAILPSDQGSFHADMRGLVFARTFARPHESTRFFPISRSLVQSQLIALHIHEGLHRSLPESIREDEGIVSQITLAITTSGATHDGVSETVAGLMPERDLRKAPPADGSFAGDVPESEAWGIPDDFKQPSNLGLGIRQFINPKDNHAHYAVHRMYLLQSNLYPFGGRRTPFGLGLEGSFITDDRGSHAGPLGISARMRAWSRKDFDLGFWLAASLNTLSAEELKNSPYGRDVYTVGVSVRKTIDRFYVENYVSLSLRGESQEKIGLINYRYSYGEIFNVKIRGGYRFPKFDLGAVAEMNLSSFKVDGGAFSYDYGRYRILSAGPELTYLDQNFSITLNGRFIFDSTKDASFDYLGNLMGAGVAQGSIGVSVSVFF